MPTPPLAGLRALEHAGWDGVYAGKLLAEGGAEVVRVVGPAGDPLDAEPPFLGSSGPSIQATWYNAGKRLVTVDLTSSAGRAEFRELAAAADILLEDWQPGNEPFTGSELLAANPRLVRVSVTPAGYGAPRPLLANDMVINALSGGASVTGDASTPPLTAYGNQTHHTAGMYAAICALASLRAARQAGQPQHVDLSSLESAVSCTEQVLMQWFFQGSWKSRVAPRQGSLHWSGAYAVYPGNEGRGVMTTIALRFADALLPWMLEDGFGADLADPEKYPDLMALLADLPHVMDTMRRWVAAHPAEDIFRGGQERHLPFGPVWGVGEAIEKSAQVPARGFIQPVAVPGYGEARLPGRLFRTNADAPPLPAAARVSLRDLAWEARPPAAPAGGPASASLPLAGVRVLDFTHVLAGPFGTRVLGDLGADVIKVNTAARAGGANSTMHPYYMSWNRNKRCIHLNVAGDDGKKLARDLAAKCDVIVENFSAGVLRRWGLDWDSLRHANPGVTVISMGGMGQDGPWSHFVTFAPTIHAMTGLTYMTNPPGEHLLGFGYSLTDHLSGLASAIATLEGLEHRERTGEGLDIDLSQYELGLHLMAPAIVDYLANGTDPEPVGNRHPFGAWAPHGIYPAAGEDRWVAIAARGDAQWRALCAVMGREELAADPRFATHEARVSNQDALDALIADWTRTRDRYEVMDACQAAGVPAGAIQDAADLTGRDPSLAARQFFGTATPTTEMWGAYGLDRFPARFSGQRPPRYEGVHEFGVDTFDVLTEFLGLDDEAVAALVTSGVLS